MSLVMVWLLTFFMIAPCKGEDMEDLVNVTEMMETLNGLQQVAEECTSDMSPSGTRDRATPCNDKTIEYLLKRIRDISDKLEPSLETYQEVVENFTAPPRIRQTAPEEKLWEMTNYRVAMAGTGNATGKLSWDTGCTKDDFEQFPNGSIALIADSNNCTACDKITSAKEAGATAVIISSPEGEGVGIEKVRSCMDTVPVVFVTHQLGMEMMESTDIELEIVTNIWRGERSVSNIILDVPAGDPDHVVMIGAHMDSVLAGPGINDDGSGTALVLEMLRTFVRRFGVEGEGEIYNGNAFRIGFWTSEEHGLLGSRHYVNKLSQSKKDKIMLYLNFDMVGSKNGAIGVQQGSDIPMTEIQDQSGYIEHAFQDIFTNMGNFSDGAGFGGSDFVSFMEGGIPIGGLMTGASQLKSEEIAAKYGGTAGEPYDPCYHKACDTPDNINEDLLLTMAKAAAAAIQNFTMDSDLPERFGRVEQSSAWVWYLVGVAVFMLLVSAATGYLYSQTKNKTDPLIEQHNSEVV